MFQKWIFLPFVIFPAVYETLEPDSLRNLRPLPLTNSELEPLTNLEPEPLSDLQPEPLPRLDPGPLDNLEAAPLTNLRRSANITEFPYAALLYREYEAMNGVNMSTSCGASILTKRILISAAHCMKASKKEFLFKVYVGSSKRQNGTAIDVIKFTKHPKYPSLPLYSYDIAVVLTRHKIPMRPTVQPISISRANAFNHGFVAGWGTTGPFLNSTSYESSMKYLPVFYIPPSLCEGKINGKIHESTFCAGTFDNNTFITMGESGSGLAVVNGKKQKIIGLPAGMYSEFPTITVFTNVTYFYGWINEQIMKSRNRGRTKNPVEKKTTQKLTR